jgi:hypothetical protein
MLNGPGAGGHHGVAMALLAESVCHTECVPLGQLGTLFRTFNLI